MDRGRRKGQPDRLQGALRQLVRQKMRCAESELQGVQWNSGALQGFRPGSCGAKVEESLREQVPRRRNRDPHSKHGQMFTFGSRGGESESARSPKLYATDPEGASTLKTRKTYR